MTYTWKFSPNFSTESEFLRCRFPLQEIASKKTLSIKAVIGEFLKSQSTERPILGGEFKKYSETMMILNAAAAPILGERGHVQFASQEGDHGNFGWMEARARKNTRSYRDSKRSENGILVMNHTSAHL